MNIEIDKKQGLIILFLILAVYLPRLLSLDVFLNIDGCSHWFSRSIKFYAGLAHVNGHDFKDTLQSSHPGVTLMILSGLSIIVGALTKFGDLNVFGHKHELFLFAKLPIAIITGLGIIFIYLILKKRYKHSLFPIAAALFIAIDPVFLAHSRYFQLDGITATFMLLALITFVVYCQTAKAKPLILSGFFTALAILSKIYAISLIPFIMTGLVLQHYRFNRFKDGLKLYKTLTMWMLIVGLTFIIIWPSMWIRPLSTIKHVFKGADIAVNYTHENTGSLRDNILGKTSGPIRKKLEFRPELLKDFVNKTSSFVLLLGIIGIVVMIRKVIKRKMDQETEIGIYLLAFFIFFLTGMSFTGKAGIRYCVICFVLFDLVAAYGFINLLSWFKRVNIYSKWGRLSAASLIIILSLLILRVFSYHPYYQSFQNELYREKIMPGWGEGLEIVAEYINNKPDAEQLTVASFYDDVLDQFFRGKVINLNSIEENTPDYIVLYASQVRRYINPKLVREYYLNPDQKPEFIACIKNLEYAWVYANPDKIHSAELLHARGPKNRL